MESSNPKNETMSKCINESGFASWLEANLIKVPSPQINPPTRTKQPPTLRLCPFAKELLHANFPHLLSALAILPQTRAEIESTWNVRTVENRERDRKLTQLWKRSNGTTSNKCSVKQQKKAGKLYEQALRSLPQRELPRMSRSTRGYINTLAGHWLMKVVRVEKLLLSLEANYDRLQCLEKRVEIEEENWPGDATNRNGRNTSVAYKSEAEKGTPHIESPLYEHEKQSEFESIYYEVDRIQRQVDLEVALGNILRTYIMQLYLAMGFDEIEAAHFALNMTRTTREASRYDFQSSPKETSDFLVSAIVYALNEADGTLGGRDLHKIKTYLASLITNNNDSKPAANSSTRVAVNCYSSTGPSSVRALENDDSQIVSLRKDFKALRLSLRLMGKKSAAHNKAHEWRVAMMEQLAEKLFPHWFIIRESYLQALDHIKGAKDETEETVVPPQLPTSADFFIGLAGSLWEQQETRVRSLLDRREAASAQVRLIEGAVILRARYAEGVKEIARGGSAVPLHRDLDWELDDDDEEEDNVENVFQNSLEHRSCEPKDLQKAKDDIQHLQRIIDVEAALCGLLLNGVKQILSAYGVTEEVNDVLIVHEVLRSLKASEIVLPKALSTSKDFIIEQVVSYMERIDHVTTVDEALGVNQRLKIFLGDIEV